ncbi:LOW QUALITY PROTEIN: heme peroxidase [Jimgerdemannia flammicorona]|uniref:Heme peroxidase n=1 Tax=Jimgerdemannia flammicorona TaxID=994334 RepID=A0A433A0Q5_9FUNG|nr:LOW QUALITY PROTEIN: heme peroxidase [Jimgerdemannia flammicorona]
MKPQFLNHDLENNKLPPLTDLSDVVPIANVTNDPVFHCTPPGTNNSNPFNPANDCFQRVRKSLGVVVNGQFEVINHNNAWVDLSTIYSENATQSDALRTHQDGMLRLRDWTVDGGGYANFTTTVKNTLVSQADTGSVVDGDIGAVIDPQILMVSGDIRASQDIPLTIMHVVWVREHNYQATRYRTLFPSATDEQLFQLARRYTIGEFQKVVYDEFLPAILCRPLSPYKGYNSSVATDTSTAFATGAFRYGHTVSRDFDMYDGCSPNGDTLLSMYDNATALSVNPTRLLFQGQVFVLGIPGSTALDYPPARILALMGGRHGDGLDNLISRNNGLPNYNNHRTYYHPQGSIYNNPACSSTADVDSDACWAVLTSNKTLAAQLKNLYGKVNKVDALVGMIAEDLNGAYLGPTVVGVIVDELTRKRDGDRFFYENDCYFSSEEISAIKSTSFRDIIQRNTGVTGLPANVFLTTEGTNTGSPRSTQCTA